MLLPLARRRSPSQTPVNHDAIRRRFESFLKTQGLKMTAQRERIFERAFETHDHFSAETLYDWMREEGGPNVSRATVYRTLNLLEDGGFIGSFDTGRGEVVYEHLLGHPHHDHLICVECGRIVEFREERIEALQEDVAERNGFELTSHTLRLMGVCGDCRAATAGGGASETKASARS